MALPRRGGGGGWERTRGTQEGRFVPRRTTREIRFCMWECMAVCFPLSGRRQKCAGHWALSVPIGAWRYDTTTWHNNGPLLPGPVPSCFSIVDSKTIHGQHVVVTTRHLGDHALARARIQTH